jgi:hypothetical protein
MENQNVLVLSRLISDIEFKNDLKLNVENALVKAGFNVAPEFVDKLKKFSADGGFDKIEQFSVTDMSGVFASAFGLESRW